MEGESPPEREKVGVEISSSDRCTYVAQVLAPLQILGDPHYYSVATEKNLTIWKECAIVLDVTERPTCQAVGTDA